MFLCKAGNICLALPIINVPNHRQRHWVFISDKVTQNSSRAALKMCHHLVTSATFSPFPLQHQSKSLTKQQWYDDLSLLATCQYPRQTLESICFQHCHECDVCVFQGADTCDEYLFRCFFFFYPDRSPAELLIELKLGLFQLVRKKCCWYTLA